MHLEINRAAAQAGKHILCEKPVGRDPQETIQSAAAAREAGLNVVTATIDLPTSIARPYTYEEQPNGVFSVIVVGGVLYLRTQRTERIGATR